MNGWDLFTWINVALQHNQNIQVGGRHRITPSL